MSPFGKPRENNFDTKPSEPREDFFEDDGVSDMENSIESHIRDLKKLVIFCRGMIETLHTDLGTEAYSTIKDLAERMVSKLESVSEDGLGDKDTLNTMSTVEDFMTDQNNLVDMFNNVNDYSNEDIIAGTEVLKQAYADI
ncbi:hypothetical protein IPJ63_00500 [Candidatus Nomurabacteria bacterium]|nr:MAG: hypothetical protein IPJ63_00500 [Candidatus Nomurabacteria bacterium]